jgi:hypothetical protein
MVCYASPSSAPSTHLHVNCALYPHINHVNNSTGAHSSNDDYSSAGNGIPNFEARITDLVTEMKGIKTELKNIKTVLNNVGAVVMGFCFMASFLGGVFLNPMVRKA